MHKRTMAWITAATLACGSAAHAKGHGFGEIDELRGLRERWIQAAADMHVPGFSVALVRDGKIAAIEGFGIRDAGSEAPVDEDTMFYIASCTKTYLTVGMLTLCAQEKVALDDPVRKHLPEFTLADARAAETITIRDLLSHRRGLSCGPAVWLDAYTGDITDERFFYWLAKETPQERLDYTNTHFTIAGRVIERVTGKSWRDYLDEAVFTPAGMDRTTGYASVLYGDANAAWPLQWTPQGYERCAVVKTDATMHAAGGLGTSAHDAARWLILQMGSGEIDGTRIIAERLSREMLTPQGRLPETNGSIRRMEGFGLGWQMGTYRGLTPYYTHGGGYAGTGAHLSFMPEKGLGVVVLANSDAGNPLADIISIDIYDRLLGAQGEDLLPQYIRSLWEREARRAATEAERTPITAAHHAGSLAGFVGEYEHPHLGTITMWVDSGTLLARAGGLPLRLYATGAADRIQAIAPSAADLILAPEIAPDGTCRAVVLHPEEEAWRFERRGTP